MLDSYARIRYIHPYVAKHVLDFVAFVTLLFLGVLVIRRNLSGEKFRW